MSIKNQQGVGLLEVLVALLLLAVAVLGFSAMQFRAIQATNETLTRSDAMVIIRNVSEDLRLLPSYEQKENYIKEVGEHSKKDMDTLKKEAEQAACKGDTLCKPEARVKDNVLQALMLAKQSDVQIGAMYCPKNGSRPKQMEKLCIIASWDETLPEMDDKKENACANQDGIYKPSASCIIMETY